jgi:hypothetical protein
MVIQRFISTLGKFTVRIVLGILVLSIYSCSKGPGPGGDATISGKLLVQSYNSNCTIKQAEFYGVDEDVYLIYGDDPSYSERVRTGPDGVFWFPYLRKGTYTVYAVTESCTVLSGDSIISKTIEISDRKETVITEDIVVIR